MSSNNDIDPLLQQLAGHGKGIFQHIHSTRGRYVKPVASPEALITQHHARLTSDTSTGDPLKQLTENTHFVFQRSQPCCKPVSSLKKADISNLKWSTVHRGCYVALRARTNPRISYSNLGSLEVIVEDERGMAIALRILNVSLSSSDTKKWIAEDTILLVLEPYCEAIPEEGDTSGNKSSIMSGIRVDHPSDIIILQPGDVMIPKHWAVEAETANVGLEDGNVCEKLKEEGNAAFRAKDYDTAIRRYTAALQPQRSSILSQSPTLHTSLLLNLAQAYLLTHSYARTHVAASDALALLPNTDATKQSRDKALFRSARASYALGRYTECVRTLNALLQGDGDGEAGKAGKAELEDAKRLREKVVMRMEERDAGKYDWVGLVKRGRRMCEEGGDGDAKDEDLDLADYVGPVEFKAVDLSTSANALPSSNSSNKPTLVASHPIAAGDLILACPAISFVPTKPPRSSTPSFTFDVSTGQITLRESPPAVRSLTARVVEKARGWENLGRQGSKLGGVLRGGEVYGKVMVGGETGIGGVTEGREEAPVRSVEGRCIIDANAIDYILSSHTTPFHPIHPLTSPPSAPANTSSFPPLLGLFPLPHLPHACLPNTVQSHLGPLVVLRACRDIAKGEAITLSKSGVHASAPIEERWEAVKGAERRVVSGSSGEEEAQEGGQEAACKCAFCEVEMKEGPEMRRKRFELIGEVKKLAERLPPAALKSVRVMSPPGSQEGGTLAAPEKLIRSTIASLTPILTSLTTTYTLPPSAHPRFALLEPLGYLAALHLALPGTPNNPYTHIESAMKANLESLHSLGYDFTFDKTDASSGDGDVKMTKVGAPHPLAVKTMMQQASVCWQVGRRRAAEGWRRACVKGVGILGGVGEGDGAEALWDGWEEFGKVCESVGWKR